MKTPQPDDTVIVTDKPELGLFTFQSRCIIADPDRDNKLALFALIVPQEKLLIDGVQVTEVVINPKNITLAEDA